MIIRIRMPVGPRPKRRHGEGVSRIVAQAAAQILGPLTVVPLALGLWRLASDLNWAGNFAIESGLFSHWQVWLAAAGLLQGLAAWLRSYGRRDDEVIP